MTSSDNNLHLTITVILELFHRWYSTSYKTQCFGNWICFRPQARGGDIPALLGPLEMANIGRCTKFKIPVTVSVLCRQKNPLKSKDLDVQRCVNLKSHKVNRTWEHFISEKFKIFLVPSRSEYKQNFKAIQYKYKGMCRLP
jgi:hypothetical protein